ncbi:MAG: BMP family ABC transporter substrate-binding protein [Clostridia bacterium]|nr:BMP family ABC transporter substrate-binding protein [Clostridia bacterium]
MKHIKKILAVILTVAALISLTACSLISEDETDITNDNIKIGVILSGDRETLSGYSGVANSSIAELTSIDYGINSERFRYAENVDVNDSAAIKENLQKLVNLECNVIWVTEPAFYDEALEIAPASPNTEFMVFEGASSGDNVKGYRANITGATYLAGLVAGTKATELKVPQIGFISKNEKDMTTLNAFAAGVKVAAPTAKIQTVFSTDASAADKLIKAGCVVLASDFESEDIAKAAQNNNAFFCSFGTNSLAETYNKSYLCAPLYDFTQYYIDTIKALVDGTEVKEYNGSFSSGATMLSDLNDQTTSDAAKAAVVKAAGELSNGTLSFEISATIPLDNIVIVK